MQNSVHVAHAQPLAVFPAVRFFRAATCIPASGPSSLGPRSTRLRVAERRVKLSIISGVLHKIKMQRLSTSRMNFERFVLPLLSSSLKTKLNTPVSVCHKFG